jgi:hypothetical protein
MSALTGLFTEIETRRREILGRDAGPWARSNPVASDLSPCARETALGILHWPERPPFEASVLARLEVGREAEPLAMSKLLQYGVKVVEAQRTFELPHRQTGAVLLRGKIDGMVEWEGRRVPFDYKTVTPFLFPRMNTVADLLAHPFFSKWPRQLWSYEFLVNIETGFLLLDNLLGEWKFIEVPLDYEQMEQILQRLEAAVTAVETIRKGAAEDAALPGYHPDAAVCRRCWAFGRLCIPPGVSGDGIPILDAPEIEAKLDRRAELEAAADEYDALDKEVKAQVRGQERLVVGNWLVQGREFTRVNKPRLTEQVVKGWQTTFERLTPKP